MASWRRTFSKEIDILLDHLFGGFGASFGRKHPDRTHLIVGTLVGVLILAAGIGLAARTSTDSIIVHVRELTEPVYLPDYTIPVRDEPASFPPNTYLPKKREKYVLGKLNTSTFFPEADLIRVEDERVWWESEHDRNDTEDDHIMHRAIEPPLRRLIELVDRNNGTLEVHDAYRPEGIHAAKSFHKVGRALDLTCDELGLEKLAKLCWAAGFDWVYFEAPRRGGHHVHASVKDVAVAD